MDKHLKLILLFIVLSTITTVSAFEFLYLLFTHTAWAVLPLGIGVASLLGSIAIFTLIEMNKK